MGPKEIPSFYLYSRGISPNLLTLGTLVYDNYTMPEVRSVTFPKLSETDFDELERQNQIISQPINGCFSTTKDSSFGLGVEALDLASVDFEYATKLKKLVVAKAGRRVILREEVDLDTSDLYPRADDFFVKVIQTDKIRKKLELWLTVAKSQWIFYKATFQRPRVFCVTGFYELSDVVAKIESESSVSTALGISSAVIGTATGVPVGGKIGPFKNGKALTANTQDTGPSIWAARFHQLKVDYLQMALDGTTPLPSNLRLREDCTHPRQGLMKDGPVIQETRKVDQPDDVKIANAVNVELAEVEDIPDEDIPDDRYWSAFKVAEARLEKPQINDGDDEDEDDDDDDDDEGDSDNDNEDYGEDEKGDDGEDDNKNNGRG